MEPTQLQNIYLTLRPVESEVAYTKERNMMCCVIWYHLYSFKKVKNTHGGVLLLVKLQALLAVMPFLIKPFAVYSITSFDVNSFICDGKEFVEKYILANEVI